MFPLFVPATRPDRIAKACSCGASAVVVDLEDAVLPDDEITACASLLDNLPKNRSVPIYVRINAKETPWYQHDITVALSAGTDGIVLPKAKTLKASQTLRSWMLDKLALSGLIETAKGIGTAPQLAPIFDRCFFGSLDFAADLGCSHSYFALAHAPAKIVLGARLAERPGPCDRFTSDIRYPLTTMEAARYSADLRSRGKLLIYPAQVAPAQAGYRPIFEQLSWAQRVIPASTADGAIIVDGKMIYAPVLACAYQIQSFAMDTAGENHD